MAQALRRILRIRQLAEEQARLEVEQAAQLARRASAACEQQTALEHRQRSTLAQSWTPQEHVDAENKRKGEDGSMTLREETADEKGWLMEEAVLEFFGWKRMRLEQLREAELHRMEPMIELYTERRRELRQTEQLLEQQAVVEAMERDRRAQAATDEWFLQRKLMLQQQLRRRERKQEKGAASEQERPPKI
jgi:hypothetical protein